MRAIRKEEEWRRGGNLMEESVELFLGVDGVVSLLGRGPLLGIVLSPSLRLNCLKILVSVKSDWKMLGFTQKLAVTSSSRVFD